jgi:hypothetical protein
VRRRCSVTSARQNSVHVHTKFNIHFNIILPSPHIPSKWSLPFRGSDSKSARIYNPSHACYMSSLSYPPPSYHPSYITRILHLRCSMFFAPHHSPMLIYCTYRHTLCITAKGIKDNAEWSVILHGYRLNAHHNTKIKILYHKGI